MLHFHVAPLIQHYGLFGIFISNVIENIAIPFPTEGAFLVAQHYIALHLHTFWGMYLFILFSQVFGAVIGYALGLFLEEGLMHYLGKSKSFLDARDKIHGWYDKYGSVTILATRLIGYVRPFSSLVAGFAEYPFLPFLLWTTVGTALFVYPTLKLTALLILIWQRYPFSQPLISAFMIISFFGWIFAIIFNRRKKTK